MVIILPSKTPDPVFTRLSTSGVGGLHPWCPILYRDHGGLFGLCERSPCGIPRTEGVSGYCDITVGASPETPNLEAVAVHLLQSGGQ